jgi:hypothetical protein
MAPEELSHTLHYATPTHQLRPHLATLLKLLLVGTWIAEITACVFHVTVPGTAVSLAPLACFAGMFIGVAIACCGAFHWFSPAQRLRIIVMGTLTAAASFLIAAG